MNIRGAGGTSGGIGQFLLGLALAGLGLYMFLDRVIVFSSVWTIFGVNAYGVALIPMTLGIAVLFFNARSILGWLLAGGSFLMIVVGIIANLTMFFKPTSLPMTLLMLGMIGAGLGLILRSFQDYETLRSFQHHEPKKERPNQLGASSGMTYPLPERDVDPEEHKK